MCIVQVRTYSDWVIDGDYDWPPKCGACQAVIQDEDTSTTRLGCLRELFILHAFQLLISASSGDVLSTLAYRSSLSAEICY